VLLGIFWKRFGTPTRMPARQYTNSCGLRRVATTSPSTDHGLFQTREPRRPDHLLRLTSGARYSRSRSASPRRGCGGPIGAKRSLRNCAQPPDGSSCGSAGIRYPLHRTRDRDTTHRVSVPSTQRGGASLRFRVRGGRCQRCGIGGNVYGDVHLGTAAAPEPTDGLRDAYLTGSGSGARVPLTAWIPRAS